MIANAERQIDRLLAGTFPPSTPPKVVPAGANPTQVMVWNALTLLAEGKAQEAAIEFQKVVDRKVGRGRPFVHVWLARSLAMVGDTSRARKAYENFFELWKYAKPDVPFLVEARKEYESLK